MTHLSQSRVLLHGMLLYKKNKRQKHIRVRNRDICPLEYWCDNLKESDKDRQVLISHELLFDIFEGGLIFLYKIRLLENSVLAHTNQVLLLLTFYKYQIIQLAFLFVIHNPMGFCEIHTHTQNSHET